QHHDRGLDLSVAPAERSRHDRHGQSPAVAALDEALGLGSALARGEGLAEPPHDRCIRREDFLDIPPFGAARRALGEHLGGRVPEHDAQIGIDRDHRVGETGQNCLVIHWSGGLEAGLDRGWPEKDAAMLRTPGPFGCVDRLQLPGTGSEAGVDRGWPEKDAAMLRTPGPFGCVDRLQLTVTGSEAGVAPGWPETGTAKLRTPDLPGCV